MEGKEKKYSGSKKTRKIFLNIWCRRVKDHLYDTLVCSLGILLILIGTLMAAYRLPQRMIDYNLQKNLILAPDSPILPKWENPDTPVYMKFYLFNITNADEVKNGSKPKLQECGPYTYRMHVPKFDITFYPNDTVSYFNNHTMLFQPDMSSGKEDDMLFHLNIPLASVGQMVDSMPSFLHYFDFTNKMLDSIGTDDVFVQHTAYEIIYGYEDPIFSYISETAGMFGLHFDSVFGFFNKFNNSHDGNYLIDTGKKNFGQVQQIERWKRMESLPYWTTNQSNMINGTDGSFLKPNVRREDFRYIYFSQMCRSLKLEYEADTEVKGIKTYKFHFANDILANASINPANEGFCVPKGNCFDSGVLNVKSCLDGAEAFVSLPHFYNAAKKYLDAVEGLEPDKEKHDSTFHVEPMSGAVLRGSRKLQINFLLRPSHHVKQLKRVRELIFPILWLAGDAEVDDGTAGDLRFVMTMVDFMEVLPYFVICSGILIILILIGCFLKKKRIFKGPKYTIGLRMEKSHTKGDKLTEIESTDA